MRRLIPQLPNLFAETPDLPLGTAELLFDVMLFLLDALSRFVECRRFGPLCLETLCHEVPLGFLLPWIPLQEPGAEPRGCGIYRPVNTTEDEEIKT